MVKPDRNTIPRVCCECAIHFLARSHNLGRFCSHSCSASFNNRGTKRHLGFKHSADVIAVIKSKRAFQVISTETRNKMSLSHAGKPKSLQHAHNIRISKRGPNHPNWKGGVTSLRKSVRKLPEYAQWRESIFSRDGYKCVLCKSTGELNADHHPATYAELILGLTCIDEALKCNALWDIKNGRTLCTSCHRKTNTFGSKNQLAYRKHECDRFGKEKK